MSRAALAGPCAGVALVVALLPLCAGRQGHSWIPSLIGLVAATPLAWSIAGRGGGWRALGGLLAGSLIAGQLAAAWAPLPTFGLRCEVPEPLGWIARARTRGAPRAGELWLTLLALLAALPQLLPRRRWVDLEGRLWRGLLGAAVLLGALQGGLGRAQGHDRGWLLAGCLAAGAAMGAAGAWAEDPRPAAPRAGSGWRGTWPWLAALPLALLVGAGWSLACVARHRPPPIVPDTPAALKTLRAIQAAQAGRERFAASLTELEGVPREVLTGVAHGYTFRYGEWGSGWAAAADPQGPDAPHLWVRSGGGVHGGQEPRPILPPAR